MKFNKHKYLEGSHAFLSASKYHWLNYSDEKLKESYYNHKAIIRGTQLQDLASTMIKLGEKMPRTKRTLNMYVNDAIGFKMTPEQVLFYSENCFGTADAISFRRDPKTGKETLRIHDLKTGSTPAHIEQLLIYAALFCLEYDVKPSEIDIELRIYQSDEIIFMNPTAEDIVPIMDKIITFDKMINRIKEEEE